MIPYIFFSCATWCTRKMNQNIFRLNVSMYEIEIYMHTFKSKSYRSNNVLNDFLIQRVFFLKHFSKVTSIAKLKNEVVWSFWFHALFKVDDVLDSWKLNRFVKLSQTLDFFHHVLKFPQVLLHPFLIKFLYCPIAIIRFFPVLLFRLSIINFSLTTHT